MVKMDWFPTLELKKKSIEISSRLKAVYHAVRPERGKLPPVDELIFTILSQSTTDINSMRGYRALKEGFADWNAVADAPVEEIEAAVRQSGLSRQKAPRIKAALQRIREEKGSITLDFLSDMAPDEALAYLMSFPGVGRKTASCVLLFSLDMPAMPVDTHVLRVSQRLGLIPVASKADEAHNMLEALLPEGLYLPFHVNVIAHGRRTCFARRPACDRCAVRDLCLYVKS